MAEKGHILIADDEEVFCNSVARLLRGEGYSCACAADAHQAADLLRKQEFDLLIADIRMPGNTDLEFVRELPRIARGLPAILVTGYPSLQTAIDSIQLPVVAYLVKPFKLERLLEVVRATISNSQVFRAVREAQERLERWQDELDRLESAIRATRGNPSPLQVSAFLALTLNHIIDALLDLKHMTDAVTLQQGVQAACRLYDCPRIETLMNAISESIEVLERTKSAFKSRQLAELRRKLEQVMREAGRLPTETASREPRSAAVPVHR